MSDQTNSDLITAFNDIPYGLLSAELSKTSGSFLAEMTQIKTYYVTYKKGAVFIPEGSQGDYIPADLRYYLVKSLIDKEARFLFAEAPDIIVEPKGDVGKITKETKDAVTILNDLLKTVFEKNKFEDQLVKASKDCFIGKRVAAMVNFNEDDGITVSFLPSTQFIFETLISNQNILTKFVGFMVINDSSTLSEKLILRKRFILEEGKVFVDETVFNGAGHLVSVLTEKTETLLTRIPAVVMINDGLTGDEKGESEVALLDDFESQYSKLANADTDSERKAMNQVKYTVDMDSRSTKNLKASPGAYWDLQSDQNLTTGKPEVGTLDSDTSYTTALQTTLDRIKTTAYSLIDMPMIDIESMSGAVTTGKALKAIYWPLIVRCKEKMKTWGPGLRDIASMIIDGSFVYPDIAAMYVSDTLIPVEYEIKIDQNQPLPEDEAEEKAIDLSEVASQVMSRKTYMKKWRGMTDDEIQDELRQIALENVIISDHTTMSIPTNDMSGNWPMLADQVNELFPSE